MLEFLCKNSDLIPVSQGIMGIQRLFCKSHPNISMDDASCRSQCGYEWRNGNVLPVPVQGFTVTLKYSMA